MTKNKSEEMAQTISLESLSEALDRSKALIRRAAKSLDVQVQDGRVTLTDALTVMRYLSSDAGEQGANSEQWTGKSRETELAVTLDIVKRERTATARQVEVLSAQLGHANERCKRLEEQLHNLMESFAYMVAQKDRPVAHSKMKSKASLKHVQGREVLYLEQPVDL